MKNLGQRVREFRLAPERKWSTSRMAREVGTSRQNIENLEAKGFGQPRYIAKLAAVMGTTIDELLGRSPALIVAEPTVVYDAKPDELKHLGIYRRLSHDDQILIDEAIGELVKASAIRREALHKIGLPTEAPKGSGNKLPLSPRGKAKAGQREQTTHPFELAGAGKPQTTKKAVKS